VPGWKQVRIKKSVLEQWLQENTIMRASLWRRIEEMPEGSELQAALVRDLRHLIADYEDVAKKIRVCYYYIERD